MGWWGKLIGGAFGFMFGGPLGAVLGAALGHNFDKGLKGASKRDPGETEQRERIQTAFFTATFSTMGCLAKADGRVSQDEISLAETLMAQMDLPPDLRRTAIRLFREGKAADFPLDAVLDQFRHECRRRQNLLQMFLEIQLQAAYADGLLDPAEEALLLRISRRLGFPDAVFRRLERMIRAESTFAGAQGQRQTPRQPEKIGLDTAYAVLNLKPSASNEDVKRAYRRLRSQHHPDKLVAKGLPEEMMKLAAQKSHEIRQAYERIREDRGF